MSASTRVVAIQPTGYWLSMKAIGHHEGKHTIRECQSPACHMGISKTNAGTDRGRTPKDFIQMLMYFEPVGQDAENEEKYGQTIQHERAHNAGSVPNLPSFLTDVTVVW